MMCTILLTYFVFYTEANENLLRVFGGRDAIDGEFPYVVQLVWKKINNTFCTGSVLTRTWTLTAAHCVAKFDFKVLSSKKMKIAYKPSDKAETAYSKVLSIKVHPAYHAALNDIAMVGTQPLLLTEYGKLSPVDYNTLYGQKVTLVGHGKVNQSSMASPVLQVLDVIVRECQSDEFAELYPKICFAPRCSSPSNVLQSLCYGDSGGPAIHASGVIAVTSGVEKIINACMKITIKLKSQAVKRHSIGTSTPTSAYIDWISNIINKNSTV